MKDDVNYRLPEPIVFDQQTKKYLLFECSNAYRYLWLIPHIPSALFALSGFGVWACQSWLAKGVCGLAATATGKVAWDIRSKKGSNSYASKIYLLPNLT